ncbi:sigma-70 family RNA polymerase sigma factor [Taklimakanibacter lacteus]|uniref:sigma-70 family RNA polymerase sigma factor n=1 Tax=Taklimakanibacter lacteus TaxID=2268456 RepID=UPI000E665039
MAGLPEDFGSRLIGFLPNLRRFAISLCRSSDLADDLVQLACERAIANASSFAPGTRFDAWMFRILRNLWIDQMRRDRTAGPREEIGLHEGRLAGDAGMAPEHRLMLRQVWSAIGDLAGDQREVLLLVCVEELSYREAADVLGIPIGTVMSRLARARANLAASTGIDQPASRSHRDNKVDSHER